MTTPEQIIEHLRSLANPEIARGMSRFGIKSPATLGIPMKILRPLAKEIGRDHDTARLLWASGLHEARILAALIEEPEKVTGRQMDRWVRDFDSWDVCDQCCLSLFVETSVAHTKAIQWSSGKPEFTKRAGFALMAVLAVHDKKSPDTKFHPFLARIKSEAKDERTYVRKAVNWALRQTGKRNERLRQRAVALAKELTKSRVSSARWIGSDALRELGDPNTVRRIRNKK